MVTVLKRILYTTLVLLTAACSTSEDDSSQVGGGSVTVAFDAKMGSLVSQGAATRTPENAIEDNAALSTKGGFGVFACYTGLHKYGDSNVKPNFMYNEHVTWNGSTSTWEYSPLKYWPNGEGEATGITGSEKHYVSFFAYAPYSDGTGDIGYCIPSFSLQGEQGNPWLTYRLHTDVDKQVDLLCANPLLDQTKPDQAERLKFQFNHALACVGDKVTIDCSEGMKNQLHDRVSVGITNIKMEVTKLEIVYSLTSKARLVLWNGGEPNWEPIYSENPLCTRTVTLVDAVPVVAYAENTSGITIENTWNDKGVFYIPIGLPGFPQTARVDLSYCVSTYNGSAWIPGPSKQGSVTINLNKYAGTAYMPGKHLYINISVNDETMTFTVTAAIEDWVEKVPQNVEAI